MKKIFMIVLIAIVFVFILWFLGFEQYVEKEWICSICGSNKKQIVWHIGYKNKPLYRPSPIEMWCVEHKVEHSHDWVNVKGDGKTIWGKVLSRAHASAPPILRMSYILEDFVNLSSQSDIQQFVNLMMNGSEEEKEELIDATLDRMANNL